VHGTPDPWTPHASYEGVVKACAQRRHGRSGDAAFVYWRDRWTAYEDAQLSRETRRITARDCVVRRHRARVRRNASAMPRWRTGFRLID